MIIKEADDKKPDIAIFGARSRGNRPKKKLICATCSEPVELKVARFCWFNKARFGENIYCRDCQQAVFFRPPSRSGDLRIAQLMGCAGKREPPPSNLPWAAPVNGSGAGDARCWPAVACKNFKMLSGAKNACQAGANRL